MVAKGGEPNAAKKPVVSWTELSGVAWFTYQNPGIRVTSFDRSQAIIS